MSGSRLLERLDVAPGDDRPAHGAAERSGALLELAALRGYVAGTSLLRGGSPATRPVVMTNCSELWACAFKNWGVIKGTKKLIAHQGDASWNCFDVATDPGEEHRLDPSECADLLPLAESTSAGKHPF